MSPFYGFCLYSQDAYSGDIPKRAVTRFQEKREKKTTTKQQQKTLIRCADLNLDVIF